MHPDEVLRLGSGGLAVILIAVAVLGRRRSSRQRSRAALGAVQIALTTLVVIWAGLLLRHSMQMRSLDLRSSGSAGKIAVLALRSDKYGAPEQRQAFFDSVMARLRDIPAIRVDDSGSALPLAGNAYYAMFFAMGDGSTAVQLPDGQQLIRWQADIGVDSLAEEINHAVKTFDRGIHYWHVGSDDSRVSRCRCSVSTALWRCYWPTLDSVAKYPVSAWPRRQWESRLASASRERPHGC
jgi:hypothetical protein